VENINQKCCWGEEAAFYFYTHFFLVTLSIAQYGNIFSLTFHKPHAPGRHGDQNIVP
jgi:hypothetical protein